jgi:hypothetical protein
MTALEPADAALALQLACVHALSIGDWAKAEALGERAVAINKRLGDRFRMQTCQVTLAYRWLFSGDLARADRALGEALETAGQGSPAQIKFWCYAGQIAARLPREAVPAAFLARLEALLAENAETSSSEAILCHGMLALARWRAGEAELAQAAAARVVTILEADLPVTYWLTWGLGATAEVYLGLLASPQPPAGAEAMARRVCAALRQYAFMLPTARAAAALWRGELERCLGHRRRAERLWRRAATDARALGMRLELARALERLGRREEARALYDAMGASWHLREHERETG